MAESYDIGYLDQLEAESLHIFREAAATLERPVLLYSIGKDSSVLLKLAQKAFAPGPIPFPLLHIDTGFKFPEMTDFRDYYTSKIGAELIVHKNLSEEAMKFGPRDTHTDQYIYNKKTKPLLDALEKYQFDGAFGGARREEEKARAKERVFSIRDSSSSWNPKNQRPELWNLYNAKLGEGQSMRIFPLSNWTESDIWAYILREEIEIVPLYLAKKRKHVMRNGVMIRIDDWTQPDEGEEIMEMSSRYRTLGCAPSTGAVPSTATTIEEILVEVLEAKTSERQTRAIDHGSQSAMEQKKRQGYF